MHDEQLRNLSRENGKQGGQRTGRTVGCQSNTSQPHAHIHATNPSWSARSMGRQPWRGGGSPLRGGGESTDQSMLMAAAKRRGGAGADTCSGPQGRAAARRKIRAAGRRGARPHAQSAKKQGTGKGRKKALQNREGANTEGRGRGNGARGERQEIAPHGHTALTSVQREGR